MPGRSLLSRLGVLACFAVIFAPPLAAARQQAPTRDQPAASPETTGTGRISVSIVAADTGTGVKRVRVMLSGTAVPVRPPAGSSTPASGIVSSSSIVTQSGSVVVSMTPGPGRVQKDGETDETGRLEFGTLPAGVYSLMVAPPAAFLRPTSSASIRLGDGESASRTIRLDRGGAIMGRVVDETGDPVAHVNVMALRKDPRSPSSSVRMSGNSGTTDDRGEFRVYGLEPGDYYISANYNVPAPYLASPPEPRLGYVPTYYPGVPTLDGARLVKVRSGQDSGGIDLGLLMGKLGRVVGTVSDSTGALVAPTQSRSAYVSLSPKGGEQAGFGRGSSIKPDGTFVISDVPPGEYVVYANVMRGEGPQAEHETVAEVVTVNGNEVTEHLRTNTGATLSGRVVIEGTLTSPPPPPGMTAAPPDARPAGPVNIMARPSATADSHTQLFAPGKSERVSEDGLFSIVGVRGSVLITAVGGGRTLKAVRRAGQDITTTPLVLAGSENIDDLEVVLTYDTGNLLVDITDDRGQPVLGAWLIAFPDDPKRWTSGSPFVRIGRAAMSPPPGFGSGSQGDQRLRSSSVPASPAPGATTGFLRQPGQFLLTRLLPGRYYVMAMESDDNGMMPFAQYDAETIAGWRRQATAVAVAVGETATVSVRAVKQVEDR